MTVDRIEQVDESAEHQRHDDPYGGHLERLFDTHLMLPFLPKGFQVYQQH